MIISAGKALPRIAGKRAFEADTVMSVVNDESSSFYTFYDLEATRDGDV